MKLYELTDQYNQLLEMADCDIPEDVLRDTLESISQEFDEKADSIACLIKDLDAEANAIISASRRECIGATIYLVGKEASTGKILGDATSCSMCRRMIINAGIERVVIRKTETEFSIVPVQQWIEEDDSIADLDYIPQK